MPLVLTISQYFASSTLALFSADVSQVPTIDNDALDVAATLAAVECSAGRFVGAINLSGAEEALAE